MRTLFSVLAMLVLTITTACGQQGNRLDAKAFSEALKADKTIQLLDVRTPTESQEKRIAGSILADFNNTEAYESNTAKLDKSKPVYVYCLAGGRSADAATDLRKKGYKTVVELKGGLLAWQKENLPLEKTASNANAAGPELSNLTLEQFQKLVAGKNLTVVDFNAKWCGPCKRMKPHMEKLSKEYGNNAKVIYIDVDYNEALSNHYRIESIPLIFIFKDGKLLEKLTGYHNEEQLRSAFGKYI